MKNTYEAPKVEIVNLSENDILKDSVFLNIGGNGNLDPTRWGELLGLK